MPSELLRCTICPKLPKFSDSSHLLTHVGSKGHLAHLHRLQVKSHQEPEAALKIAIYNHWFQEHGVAQLLSERMQQKEAKQADKNAANDRRAAVAAAVAGSRKKRGRKSTSSGTLPLPPAVSAYDPQPPHLKSRRSATDFDDFDYTPLRPSSNGRYPMLPSSPPKMMSSFAMEDHEDEDCPSEEDHQAKASSSPQLKGTKWPGMGLFDAASLELQKKRNQRKDSSVLKRLERLSRRVVPTETVHSAAGVVLKHRHMDDLENDSPVEGEITIPPPTPKQRKSSRPRIIKKVKKSKRRSGRTRRHAASPLADPSNLVTSDMEETPRPRSRSRSRFIPTEEENNEFKLALRNFGRKKKKGHFRIYEDSSPGFGGDGSSDVPPSAYVDASTTGAQLTYQPPLAWPQQQAEPYDHFKMIRSRLPVHPVFGDIGQGKENVNPLSASHGSPGSDQFTNPLFFQTRNERAAAGNPFPPQIQPDRVAGARLDPFEDDGDDAFMPVKNPLMTALEQMNSQHDHFGTHGVSRFHVYYRQPLFAP